MTDLILHPVATRDAPPDPAGEITRLEALLAERKAELIALQEELRAFKTRYTHVVGSRLAELAEVEREIGRAEERRLGIEAAPDDGGDDAAPAESAAARPVQTSLRRLFWSVAKMFHPDHAASEGEAARRHTIMAEAGRAYREGDVESLHTLLGDEDLRYYCAAPHDDTELDDAARFLNLKEELRTVEFGIKRVRQDGLYRLKVTADEAAAAGRDSLTEMAERIGRQIEKARRRLEHLS